MKKVVLIAFVAPFLCLTALAPLRSEAVGQPGCSFAKIEDLLDEGNDLMEEASDAESAEECREVAREAYQDFKAVEREAEKCPCAEEAKKALLSRVSRLSDIAALASTSFKPGACDDYSDEPLLEALDVVAACKGRGAPQEDTASR